MFKFFIEAISKGLAFSKAEAKGTFVLIIIVLLSITSFRFLSNRIKTRTPNEYDPTELTAWVKEVQSSYSEKRESKKSNEPVLTDLYKNDLYKKDRKRTSPRKKEASSTTNNIKLPVLDLNTASSEELQKVKGIGKVYSERIIKYRELLGGYYSIEQLKEVYGLSNDVIAKISERFSIKSDVERFAINSDSVKHLAKHPYLSYDLAWVIINYRKQNGDINSFEDLRSIKALNDSVLFKLKPYLE